MDFGLAYTHVHVCMYVCVGCGRQATIQHKREREREERTYRVTSPTPERIPNNYKFNNTEMPRAFIINDHAGAQLVGRGN